MSDQRLEPLPDDVDALFAAERAAPLPAASAAVEAAVYDALVRRGVASTAAATLTGAKLIALVTSAFAVGAAVGGAIVYRVTNREATAQTQSQPPPMNPVIAHQNADESPTERLPTAAEPAPAAAPRSPSRKTQAGAPPPSRSDDALLQERQALETARSALARGRPDDALEALRDHQQRFAAGQLREEREALRVLALAASGRRVEASEAAHAFALQFPSSLLLPTVEAAVKQ